jgi:hypothetical protein
MNNPETNDAGHDGTWGAAVSVTSRNTSIVTICGPAEAYDFLMHRWPGVKGAAFAKAKRAATTALTRRGTGAEARACFVAACLAADCLIRETG